MEIYAFSFPGHICSGFRLALRYQVRSGGPRLTLEESQTLENRRIRLQKLINMFQHQADNFILQNKAMHDLPISFLHDYDDYDDIDDMDDSEDLVPTARMSTGSQNNGSNTEDIPILLPSTLGMDWCTDHGVQSLAIKESRLRFAQANDSIDKIRVALGLKAVLFRTLVRSSKTQTTKTRARTAVTNVDTTVHQHARNYCMARDAYLKVIDVSGESPGLPALKRADLRINTAVLGAAEVGQRNKQLPWIWSFGISETNDESWMDECMLPFMFQHLLDTHGLNSQ